VEVGFKTDKGISRSNNEDAFFVMKEDRVFIVADGVGGNSSGEIASRTTVNSVANFVEEHPVEVLKTEDEIRNYFLDCISDANRRVRDVSRWHKRNRGMATTVVAAFVPYNRENSLYIVNVGDSRAYVLRENSLEQITEDHTYVNTLVKAGIITKAEAMERDDKNMITRAIGADDVVEADFFSVKIRKGDIVLICTDGLYSEVTEPELIAHLTQDKSMSEICAELVETANLNGGSDNITAICIRITEEDIYE
jgi:serine/threonine protein phosphatase PrpC